LEASTSLVAAAPPPAVEFRRQSATHSRDPGRVRRAPVASLTLRPTSGVDKRGEHTSIGVDMKVSEILGRNRRSVETVGPDVPVAEAAERLSELNIGSLVVVDDGGQVVAILTERDIVRGVALSGARAAELSVVDLASKALVCTPDVEVDQVMRVMTNNRARHVVAMVGGRLEGVISIGDVVHARLDVCELEVSVLRDYSRLRGPATISPR